jgi:hypothetical protein
MYINRESINTTERIINYFDKSQKCIKKEAFQIHLQKKLLPCVLYHLWGNKVFFKINKLRKIQQKP